MSESSGGGLTGYIQHHLTHNQAVHGAPADPSNFNWDSWAVALTLGAPARAEEDVCALAPPLTLRLPAGLKAQEAAYRAEVEQAVRKVVSRFADWGYPVCAEDLIDQVVVFDDMALARQALAPHDVAEG